MVPVSLSDHYLVYCIRKFQGGVLKEHKNVLTRRMKHFVSEKFIDDLISTPWDQIAGMPDDVNDAVSDWTNMFSLILEKHAPCVKGG